ncbi:hypothetical protein H6P81_001335 [Aristolochia fimbriata]|uniref:Uncharacterized protein n=1 Tax=Aristolochia fimbriata TaxID=158543 RepID=A0AAV7FAL6_ARIFI|nr:hypothetical protein H6P81_001335 [Aristolochia fimbriata]
MSDAHLVQIALLHVEEDDTRDTDSAAGIRKVFPLMVKWRFGDPNAITIGRGTNWYCLCCLGFLLVNHL